MAASDPRPVRQIGGEAHVWYVFTDRVEDNGLLGEYWRLLSADERRRHARFVFAEHRQQFLVAHALVRTVLSRYAEVPPEAWQFEFNSYGHPSIARSHGLPHLRFNLSHCHALAACAVTSGQEVGVDVEDIQRRGNHLSIPQRYFSPLEVARLKSLEPHEQNEAFFAYWTLKEAYIKARGLGLSLPLDDFSFDLQPGRPPRISFSPRIEDDPSGWQFHPFRFESRYRGALAVRREGDSELTVRLLETVPLVSP